MYSRLEFEGVWTAAPLSSLTAVPSRQGAFEKAEDVVSKQAAEFYMKRFGGRINDDDVCPEAMSAEVYAYWGDAERPLLWGTSAAADGWTEWEWKNL